MSLEVAAGEESWLLEDGSAGTCNKTSNADRQRGPNSIKKQERNRFLLSLAKQLCGVAIGVLLGVFIARYQETSQSNFGGVGIGGPLKEQPPSFESPPPEETLPADSKQPLPPLLSSLSSTNSKYRSFQALNFQLYTGGAPVILEGSNDNKSSEASSLNPECASWTNNNTTPSDHHTSAGPSAAGGKINDNIGIDVSANGTRHCYLGHENVTLDVEERLAIMYDAVERAYEQSIDDPNTLKIFVAPEFFFRGRNGAYLIPSTTPTTTGEQQEDEKHPLLLFQGDDDDENNTNGECQEGGIICNILSGLEKLTADKRFEDWIFLFGTVVVAEVLPVKDEFDYLFYNFGLLYKGYDPQKESHHGKRFLVPKRYVSTSDFLHQPSSAADNKQEEKAIMKYTREIYEYTQEKEEEEAEEALLRASTTQQQPGGKEVEFLPQAGDDDDGEDSSSLLYVPLRKKYDRQLWHTYKAELEKLDYTMIEYGWFMMDGITLTVEICLDHDLRTALTSFLVDSVLPSPTLIPSSHDNVVEYVDIPRYQAQLSLVASAGMTVSETSMALVHGGSIILQDGQADDEPEMIWAYECFKYEWQFVGGSEVVQRNATMTPTEVVFSYNVSKTFEKHSIYGNDDEEDIDGGDASWKQSLRGVFSTAKYEPMIRVFEPLPIAEVF